MDVSGRSRRCRGQGRRQASRSVGAVVRVNPTQWDMAISVSDFVRILRVIPQCRDAHMDGGLMRVPLAGGEVCVRYAALPDRVLGLLRLPATRIDMAFRDVPEGDARSFLNSFELHFRRGGG